MKYQPSIPPKSIVKRKAVESDFHRYVRYLAGSTRALESRSNRIARVLEKVGICSCTPKK